MGVKKAQTGHIFSLFSHMTKPHIYNLILIFQTATCLQIIHHTFFYMSYVLIKPAFTTSPQDSPLQAESVSVLGLIGVNWG